MKIEITDVSICKPGGAHYTFEVLVNDGPTTVTRRVTRDQFAALIDSVQQEAAFAVLLRNYILGHPGQTPAQLKAGLLEEVWYI